MWALATRPRSLRTRMRVSVKGMLRRECCGARRRAAVARARRARARARVRIRTTRRADDARRPWRAARTNEQDSPRPRYQAVLITRATPQYSCDQLQVSNDEDARKHELGV